ncbi:MAG TPA: ATP-binding cassette domain-containing protein [Methylococcus sp.]|nr:ATP-binding cassette domain-containing protein [Methylococcus sp.]
MIEIHITRKEFPAATKADPVAVIGPLDLTLTDAEFICLVGPSGCGKTTLLHLVAGLDRDFEGQIRFAGIDTRPHIGYVFQEPRLLPWRTVRQNIELASPPDEIDPHLIDHLLAVMDLTSVQHQFPERLSLGMSRRVALARAFSIRPDLLLMDEPFVSLDAPTSRRIRELLLKVWEERPHTVLFVTHDLREAIALADRIVFLTSRPMKVIEQVEVKEPREQRQREAWVEAFRGQLLATYPALRTLL